MTWGIKGNHDASQEFPCQVSAKPLNETRPVTPFDSSFLPASGTKS